MERDSTGFARSTFVHLGWDGCALGTFEVRWHNAYAQYQLGKIVVVCMEGLALVLNITRLVVLFSSSVIG
jgi:hypothetical protein